jgi:hypothetical protein
VTRSIKAIRAEYKGIWFRSRTEARWAVFFDSLGVQWEYEKEGYQLKSGWYLPDFWLPEVNSFVEVKPDIDDERRNELTGRFGCQHVDTKEEVLCAELSAALAGRVYVAFGNPYSMNGMEAFLPASHDDCGVDWLVDYPHYPCMCSECGKFGIEFWGKAERICESRCDTKTKYSGKFYEKIKKACEASRVFSFWDPKRADQS